MTDKEKIAKLKRAERVTEARLVVGRALLHSKRYPVGTATELVRDLRLVIEGLLAEVTP